MGSSHERTSLPTAQSNPREEQELSPVGYQEATPDEESPSRWNTDSQMGFDRYGHSSPSPPRESSNVSTAAHIPEIVVTALRPDKNHFPKNTIITSKYTWYNFFPKNLFEQFKKLATIYFLTVAIISWIPGVSPYTPWSNTIPLIFILCVAMGKAIYEDVKRHRADRVANGIKVKSMHTAESPLRHIRSKDVCTGDILLLAQDEMVMADCIPLSTSGTDGVVYIDTANLDGQTSLKTRRTPKCTRTLFSEGDVEFIPPAFADKLMLLATVEQPGPELNVWKGFVTCTGLPENDGEPEGVNIAHFLPRGSVIRNTEWTYGLVVYSGVNTKLFRNLKKPPIKRSHLQSRLNIVVLVLAIVNALTVLAYTIAYMVWIARHHVGSDSTNDPFYLAGMVDGPSVLAFFKTLGTFYIFLSYLMPISLFVTVEVIKAFQAGLMAVDHRMSYYDPKRKRWRFCIPRSSDLNEELSQVSYIFSDKTGTLTENIMKGAAIYALGYPMEDAAHDELAHPGQLAPQVEAVMQSCGDCTSMFQSEKWSQQQCPWICQLALMAMCNSVVVNHTDEGEVVFESVSPDEVALAATARNNGLELVSRLSNSLQIRCGSYTAEIEILQELEFDPTRKMMSLIVRCPQTRDIYILTKGADTALRANCIADVETLDKLDKELKQMATKGLRTLVYGRRKVEEEEYSVWAYRFAKANTLLVNREEALAECFAKVENGLSLVGASGVEDRLQDSVPETIHFLRAAGITIWMLTGDKRETALFVAATCALIEVDAPVIQFNTTDLEDKLRNDPESPHSHEDIDTILAEELGKQIHDGWDRLNSYHEEESRETAMCIDGGTLRVMLENYEDDLFNFGKRLKSAVGCRLTPLQKSQVVQLFQHRANAISLAIGDGANDVSMILTARVGVGIMGHEGAQAELASDYAIPRFKHLRTLLALHGRYSWYRTSTTIQYSFYKNIGMFIILVWYAPESAFSGQTPIDGWLMTMFNTFFTALPPFVIGCFDRDIPPDVAYRYPQLYKTFRDRQLFFNFRTIIQWLALAIFHSLWCAMAIRVAMRAVTFIPNWSLMHYGTELYVLYILTVDITAAFTIMTWDAFQLASMMLSIFGAPVIIFGYSAAKNILGTTTMYKVMNQVLSTGESYWFAVDIILLTLMTLVFQYRRRPKITLSKLEAHDDNSVDGATV